MRVLKEIKTKKHSSMYNIHKTNTPIMTGKNNITSKNTIKAKKSKKSKDAKIKYLENRLNREFNTVFQKTMIMLYIQSKGNKKIFKANMHKLLDSPKNNKSTVDSNLNLLFKTMKSLESKGKLKQDNNAEPGLDTQAGGVMPAGPYLQRLTTIGDQPITGNDMAKAIEEIITVLNDLQYLQEDGGPNIRGFNVLLNYFNGDVENMKYYLRYYFAPKFYKGTPPFINFDEIGKRLDNIIDMLNIYKSDKRIKNQFSVETGIKPETVLGETFADKLISKWDKLDQQYSRFNRYRKLQFF